MTREEAREKAMNRVCFMSLGVIEDECQERGFRIFKDRQRMEQRLIKAFTEEYLKAEAIHTKRGEALDKR